MRTSKPRTRLFWPTQQLQPLFPPPAARNRGGRNGGRSGARGGNAGRGAGRGRGSGGAALPARTYCFEHGYDTHSGIDCNTMKRGGYADKFLNAKFHCHMDGYDGCTRNL
jgi:hypothetical protein